MLDMITEILQHAQRMTGLKNGTPANITDSPPAKQTLARQNVWTGNEYNHPSQPISTDIQRYVKGHVTGNEDMMLTGRGDLYARAGMNDRPFPEQVVGIAGIADKADMRARELYPAAAKAQQDQPVELKTDATGGDVDTARHTMLSAMMPHKVGYATGKLALDYHEAFGLPAFQSNPRESIRDTRNNAQGWLLGENTPFNNIEGNAKKITDVMSINTATKYLPAQATVQRQSVWGN